MTGSLSRLYNPRQPSYPEGHPGAGDWTILNVGSGGRPCREAVNLDICPDEAGGHMNRAPQPPQVLASAMDLPFRDGVFDLCLVMHTLEHLMRPWDAMAEFRRVMKDDARLLVEVPNAKKVPHERRDHLYSWTVWSLRNLQRECGFRKLRRIDELIDAYDLHVAAHERWNRFHVLRDSNQRVFCEKRDDDAGV